MTNTEHLSGLVCNLTELELKSFLEGIRDHIYKDKQSHLLSEVFGEISTEEIDDLEEKISDLQDEVRDTEIERDQIQDKLDEVKSALPDTFEEMTEDDFKKLESILK